MVSVRRTTIDVLTRPRLREIAAKVGIDFYAGTPRPDMVDSVSRSHSIRFKDLLPHYLRNELKLACQRLDLDGNGRGCRILIQRLVTADRRERKPATVEKHAGRKKDKIRIARVSHSRGTSSFLDGVRKMEEPNVILEPATSDAHDEPTRVELVWPGKRREVDRVVLPFQCIEVVNESRATREAEKAMPLARSFKAGAASVGSSAWRNKLIWGDNKYVLGSLLEQYAGQVDLIYIDPPFATVRNVTVILGLRPFTSDANILPEQAVGRGLRLIRDMPSDYAQVVEIVGTPKFEEFVKELEVEGVGIGSTKTPPPPGVHIFPMKERAEYDIEIPQLSQTYSRNYKDISVFDVAKLPAGVVPLNWKPGDPINVVISHGLTEVQLAKKSIAFDPDSVFLQDVLASLTQSIIRTAKLGCQFKDVYPIVEAYVAQRFFESPVDLTNTTVARVLGRHEVGSQFIRIVAESLGKHSTQTEQIKLKPEPIRLSETRAFIWRRRQCDAKKTIFNKFACFNGFEEEFGKFLDKVKDVEAFAKLAEWFTGFGLEYLSEKGSVRLYYPDFVVRVRNGTKVTMWVIETKGREDWDTEVPRKDAHAEWWCEQVTKETGIEWCYAKLPYRRYHGNWPDTFAGLVESLKPAPGLPLIFESTEEKEAVVE